MKFNKYIKQFKRPHERADEIRRIAQRLEISPSYIRGFLVGLHNFPPKYAIPLYKMTKGQVSLHLLCPDVYPEEYKPKI